MNIFDFFKEKDIDDDIESFVNEILQNEKINSGIPDTIEKKLYVSLITKLVNITKKVIENVTLTFFCYELRVIIQKI